MAYRIQEVKVGLIVVISVLLLIFFLLLISGIDFKKDTVIYTTQLTYVGGLEVGTPVRMGGVMVGRIAAILFPDALSQKIKLVLELQRETPVKTDSRAFLTSIGLLGEFYVEINPGSPDAPRLPPGSDIPALETSTFSQLSTMMGEMAASAESTIVGINYLLRQENQQQITDILKNTNRMLSANTTHIQGMLQNFEELTEQLLTMSRQLNNLLSQNQEVLSDVLVRVDSTLQQTQQLTAQLNSTLRIVERQIQDGAPEFRQMLRDLEQTSRNLQDFSQTIRTRPWLLVRKAEPKPRIIPEK